MQREDECAMVRKFKIILKNGSCIVTEIDAVPRSEAREAKAAKSEKIDDEYVIDSLHMLQS